MTNRFDVALNEAGVDFGITVEEDFENPEEAEDAYGQIWSQKLDQLMGAIAFALYQKELSGH